MKAEEDGGGQSHRLRYCKSHQGREAWEILLCLHFTLLLENYLPQHHSASHEDSHLRTVLGRKRQGRNGEKAIKVAKVEKQSPYGEKPRPQPNCQPLQVSMMHQH